MSNLHSDLNPTDLPISTGVVFNPLKYDRNCEDPKQQLLMWEWLVGAIKNDINDIELGLCWMRTKE